MERVRPERSEGHPPLPWREGFWVQSFENLAEKFGPDSSKKQPLQPPESQPKTLSTENMYRPSSQELTPSYAMRRIALLFENHKYEDCAILINRLNLTVLETIVSELPMDIFVEATPMSLGIIDVLFTKLYTSDEDNFPVDSLVPDKVVKHIIHWLANCEDPAVKHKLPPQENSMPFARRILHIVYKTEPKVLMKLRKQRNTLNKTIESLGKHGMVDASDNKLMALHDALRQEFDKMSHQYRNAIQKLDELSLAHRSPIPSSVNKGPAPTGASHQRLLQMSQTEVQDRLIKNKSLLNAVEPAASNTLLSRLLKILEDRIEYDKDVLFYFSELKKESKDLPQNAIVAALFQRFSNAYTKVLEILKEVSDEDSDEDAEKDECDGDDFKYRTPVSSNCRDCRDGHHHKTSAGRVNLGFSSNSQGNSNKDHTPSKSPTHPPHPHSSSNGAPHSNLLNNMAAVTSGSSDPKEVHALRSEVHSLRKELVKSKEMIVRLQEREKHLQDRLSEQAQKQLAKGSKFEDLNLGDNRPTQLIRQYGALYSEARLDALDALDDIQEISQFDDLKGKLLFSVVVLAFRSVSQSLRDLKVKVGHLLCLPTASSPRGQDPVAKEMETNIELYLRKTADRYDVSQNISEVCAQVYSTLYDYPSLKNCEGLKTYIQECVKLMWKLVVQNPPIAIEYEMPRFSSNMHTRFHSSDSESDDIQCYLWPALVESDTGHCLFKGVVVTYAQQNTAYSRI